MSKSTVTLSSYERPAFNYSIIDETLAAQARDAAGRIKQHQHAAVVEIGRELNTMKAALAHGHFLAWIEAEFGFSRRTATNMMQVATQFGDPAKWATVSHLPAGLIYQLASPSTPSSVREAIVQVPAGQHVTLSTVKSLIAAQRKKAARPTKAEIEAENHKRELDRRRREREAEKERQERQREREAAKAAIDFLKDRLGDDFQTFKVMADKVSGSALRDAITEHFLFTQHFRNQDGAAA